MLPFFTTELISTNKSSIWLVVGFITTDGSNNPVGLIICSTNFFEFSFSHLPGVADTKIVLETLFSHSSNFRGLLSKAAGSLNP